MSRPVLLFDMDGTLVDSEDGIVACVQYALGASGRPVPSAQTVRPWIGPPLKDTFDRLFPDEPEAAARAVALYKQHYDAEGWRQCRPYPGIAEVLAQLQAAGHRMAVVTSKTERFAERIVAAQGWSERFASVVGTSDDGRRRYKADLVAEALRRLDCDPAQALMIGDRRMDVEGAQAHGLPCIGVLWGFGDAAELRQAGACRLVSAPSELPAAIDG